MCMNTAAYIFFITDGILTPVILRVIHKEYLFTA